MTRYQVVVKPNWQNLEDVKNYRSIINFKYLLPWKRWLVQQRRWTMCKRREGKGKSLSLQQPTFLLLEAIACLEEKRSQKKEKILLFLIPHWTHFAPYLHRSGMDNKRPPIKWLSPKKKNIKPLDKGGVTGPANPKMQALPEWGRGGLTLAWIFVKDLSTCTEGPQRWSFITQKW